MVKAQPVEAHSPSLSRAASMKTRLSSEDGSFYDARLRWLVFHAITGMPRADGSTGAKWSRSSAGLRMPSFMPIPSGPDH